MARLAEYRRLDARVGACDFAQALLRIRRDDPAAAEEAASRAKALGTREGARLARRPTADGAAPGGRLARRLRTGAAAPEQARRRTKGMRILVEPEERRGSRFPAGRATRIKQ
ncbi:hypothetical protein J2Z21_007634 [Streptomyces griseochromogenes]|uniref:Uncharacterized protein n=1 Tax=Streptomyces griseochromogenes TaxID=68214 RepID=A0A1B1B407_9ACTN|nr:hypothetical protein AVL59_31945 [Streptomyces griseochromogenes]MBP2054624.1 hypothetical protein [Streptomyces griseochromogenes]